MWMTKNQDLKLPVFMLLVIQSEEPFLYSVTLFFSPFYFLNLWLFNIFEKKNNLNLENVFPHRKRQPRSFILKGSPEVRHVTRTWRSDVWRNLRNHNSGSVFNLRLHLWLSSEEDNLRDGNSPQLRVLSCFDRRHLDLFRSAGRSCSPMQAGDGCQRSSRWGKKCFLFFPPRQTKETWRIWDILSVSDVRRTDGECTVAETEERVLLPPSESQVCSRDL